MPEGLTGSLTQWPLPDILNMLCSSRQVGRIEFSDGPNRADVYVRDGAAVHAVFGSEVGEPVIAQILGWTRGTFSFEPRVAAGQQSIDRPLAEVLSDAASALAERARIRERIPSAEVVPFMVATVSEPVLLEVADWALLAEVNRRATITVLAGATGRDEWELTRHLYRLASNGLVDFQAQPSRADGVVPFPALPAPIEPPAPPAPRLLATPGFFRELTSAAAHALGPIAPVVVDDGLDVLNQTREEFPRDMASQLVEFVAMEILDDAQRVRFQQVMLQWLRNVA